MNPGDLALGLGFAYFLTKAYRPGKCCNVVSSLQLVLGDSSSSDSSADFHILFTLLFLAQQFSCNFLPNGSITSSSLVI